MQRLVTWSSSLDEGGRAVNALLKEGWRVVPGTLHHATINHKKTRNNEVWYEGQYSVVLERPDWDKGGDEPT